MPFNPSKEKEIVRYSGYLTKYQSDKLEKYAKRTGIAKAKVLGQLLDLLEDKELTSSNEDKYVTIDKFNEEIIQLKSFIEEELSKVKNNYVEEAKKTKDNSDSKLSKVKNSYVEEKEELNVKEDELLEDNTEQIEKEVIKEIEKVEEYEEEVLSTEKLSKVNNGYEEENKIKPNLEFLKLPVGEVTVKQLVSALKCDRNVFAQIAKRKRSKLPFEDFWEYLEVEESMKGKRASYSWSKIK
jgi:hypothetical protein